MKPPGEIGTIIPTGDMQLREGKRLAQGHVARNHEKQDQKSETKSSALGCQVSGTQ